MDNEIVEEGGPFELANEYTAVRIAKVRTHNGERLRIEATRTGHEILLDPVELESLSWQSHEVFARFLEDPFGQARFTNESETRARGDNPESRQVPASD